jgi:hypothetical protein
MTLVYGACWVTVILWGLSMVIAALLNDPVDKSD